MRSERICQFDLVHVDSCDRYNILEAHDFRQLDRYVDHAISNACVMFWLDIYLDPALVQTEHCAGSMQREKSLGTL